MFGFLFSPFGRINRYQYWLWFFVPYIVISVVAGIADFVAYGPPKTPGASGPISLVVTLFFLWPSFAVTIKRFHDRGMTGWWAIIPMLPLFVAAAAVAPYLSLTPGMTPQDFVAQFRAIPEMTRMIAGLLVASAVALGLYSLVQAWFLPSQMGENQYGEEPPKR